MLRKMIGLFAAVLIALGGSGCKLISTAPPTVVPPPEDSPPAAEQSAAEISVTLDIDFSAVYEAANYEKLDPALKNAALPQDGTFGKAAVRSAKEGSTALDVLRGYCDENGIMLDVRHGMAGISDYVRGIGGLSEGDCTRNSGWVYEINGTLPDVGMSDTVMKDGEHLFVRYIVY